MNYLIDHTALNPEILHGKEPINSSVAYQIATGQIPDFRAFCLDLAEVLNHKDDSHSTLQYVQILHRLKSLEPDQVRRIIKNPESRHVLMSNKDIELVLNHWKPGRVSDVHGHPGEACLFKLLKGKLMELRYTPDMASKLMETNCLRSGNISYIDDGMAYHQVGNPFGSSAISLHLYLK